MRRWTNLALFVLLGLAFTTGWIAFFYSTAPSRVSLVVHAVSGYAIVALTPWKAVIAAHGIRRRRPGWWASLVFTGLVTASVLAGVAMIVEAGLSFVGLGVQPPDSSWGSMLATSFRFISNDPALMVWPGMCVIVTVLALNLLGDGIRDSLGREIRRVS